MVFVLRVHKGRLGNHKKENFEMEKLSFMEWELYISVFSHLQFYAYYMINDFFSSFSKT